MHHVASQRLALSLTLVGLGGPVAAQDVCAAVESRELAVELPSPRLWTPDGAPVLGGPFSVQIQGGPGGAPALLVYSTAERPIFLPQFSATLYPGLPALLMGVILDPTGDSPVLGHTPSVGLTLCGVELVAQALVQDGSAPGGVSVSNGLRLRFGEVTGQMLPGRRFPTGDAPVSVAAGDFDADGSTDIAVANASPSTVTVLLGAVDATLSEGTPYAVSGSPESVTTLDVNADGIRDIATACSAADVVDVLIGASDGTFTLVTPSPVTAVPVDLVAGDFDADGFVDVSTVSSGGPPSISTLLGAGDGTFSPATFATVGVAPVVVRAADFDEDGFLDLVVVNSGSDDVSVLLGAGDGTFPAETRYPTPPEPRWVAVGDVDEDGSLDLAVANDWFEESISILDGHGDGSFGAPAELDLGDGKRFVELVDVDADGHLDVAAGYYSVEVALGNGDGTFGPGSTFAESLSPNRFLFAPMNDDAELDLVVLGQVADSAGIYPGRGDGTFAEVMAFPAGSQAKDVELIDLNLDGHLDAVEANSGFGTSAVLLGLGGGAFDDPVFYPSGFGSVDVEAADLNGDGLPDVVFANSSAEELAILLGNGDGTLGAPTSIPTGALSSVAIEHLDADGDLDLLLTNRPAGELLVLLGNGDGTFSSPTVIAIEPLLWTVRTGDLDGNGTVDAVVHHAPFIGPGDVAVLLGSGDGSFGPPTALGLEVYASELLLSDVDGDDVLDLALAYSGFDGGELTVALGNGDGTFGAAETIPYASSGNVGFAAGDFDGNGTVDFFVASAPNSMKFFGGAGDGTFDPPIDFDAGPHYFISGLFPGDVDSDGNTDLVITADGQNDLMISLNQVGEP